MKKKYIVLSVLFLCVCLYFFKRKNEHNSDLNIKNKTSQNQKKQDQNKSNKVTTNDKQKTLATKKTRVNRLPAQDDSMTKEDVKETYNVNKSKVLSVARDIEYYISPTHKIIKNSGQDFDESLGKLVQERFGYFEYKANGVSLDQNFPVVISKLNNQVGYLTGEIILPLSTYKKVGLDFDVQELRTDKDLDRVFIQVKDYQELKKVAELYSLEKNFQITVKTDRQVPF